MQCYTELTPPTAVTHSLSLSLLSAQSKELIVAKTSQLQIFNIKDVPIELENFPKLDEFEQLQLDAEPVPLRTQTTNTSKLVLVAEYDLSGTITSLARIKVNSLKSGGDALLVSFKDAKLSLVEWDPQRHGLSTISIHYYEQEDLQESPWAQSIRNCSNYLSADPGSRCAAFKFGLRNLAILPFRQGDEDIHMDDDWDEELDGPRPLKDATQTQITHSGADETPYRSSFVLRLPALDPDLIHPIHLAFLHEYREPTFGILSSTHCPSSSLLTERKDCLTYMVITLDLHQKASTTILSVGNLPYDLFKVIPLTTPVGGAILLGNNELIHIDQGGKASGIAVNTFAKQCTGFTLTDQSDLGLRLEGCKVDDLFPENGEKLLIPRDGHLVILSFILDGRSVSGMNIRQVADNTGLSSISSDCSSTTYLGPGLMFIASESTDSILLGWSKKISASRRPRAGLGEGMGEDSLGDDDNDDLDDDLYGEESSNNQSLKTGVSANHKPGDLVFRVHDVLINIAPLKDVTLGRSYQSSEDETDQTEKVMSDLELVLAVGQDQGGALAIIAQELQAKVICRFEFPEAKGIWTMSAKKPLPKGLQVPRSNNLLNGEYSTGAQYDNFMIISKTATGSAESSEVYALASAGFESLTGTEFEPAAGSTVEAGILANGMRIIQVLKSEVRSYDGDLGLAQILPMYDDDTGTEPRIISASFADPYLLLIRDDSSIFIAQCDDNNELEEVEREDDTLLTTRWLSGSLFADRLGNFYNLRSDKGGKVEGIVFMFLLSAEGALHLRSSNDDLTIYEPFNPKGDSSEERGDLHFQKISNPRLARNPTASASQGEAEDIHSNSNKPMRAISNLGGYSTVFLPGQAACFVLKSAKSSPKVIKLIGRGVRGMSSFHTEGCDRGFIYVDNKGAARVSQFHAKNSYELGVALRKVEIGQTTHAVAYHPESQTYVVGTSTMSEFELPITDDHRQHWQREDISLKPSMEKGFIKLLVSSTWEVISTIELGPFETIMCIKTLNLEISETTNERKQLIVVGTALCKGEDLASKGRIYVYDIVTVVPELDRPETNKSLKLLGSEEVRGAVTAISEVGTQGFMLVAQGQKCMVRGLKDDGSILPVAFMDMNCYVTSLKELRGTGLCVMADALKGIWFSGYTEEPYRMQLFGKSNTKMEVIATEILPDGKDLYIVASDADSNLHILQYDPEHPKSLQGHLLLHRTAFSLGGHLPTTMTLMPRPRMPTITSPEEMGTAVSDVAPEVEVLITSTTGSLGLLSPLTEVQYRRLSTLANHLTNTLYHTCGLNPRAYRLAKDAPEGVGGARTIVDGGILLRWSELGSQRRAEVAARSGMDVEDVREDLAALMGGLEYP